MKHFAKDEHAAVTVDWVVLTAGLVGLGLATASVIFPGAEDLSHDIADQTRGSMIITSFASEEGAEAEGADEWWMSNTCTGTTALYDAVIAQAPYVGADPAIYEDLFVAYDPLGPVDESQESSIASLAYASVPIIPSMQSTVASLSAVDRDTATAEEVAAITGQPASYIEELIGRTDSPNDLINDLSGYIDYSLAITNANLQNRIETTCRADTLGIDYSEHGMKCRSYSDAWVAENCS